jgi:hypothetical protein
VARKQRLDRSLTAKLDAIERSMFGLKLEYEKYFMGLEALEPIRVREDVKRAIRNMMSEGIRNKRQAYRFRQLRARFMSLDNYITRNMVMVERGTHPKMKFRADRKDKSRKEAKDAERRRRPVTRAQKEEAAYREVYNRYMNARDKCGQGSGMSFESVREVLTRQVRTIKSRYQCNSVRFKVTVEDGKAKVKAVPLQ